MIPSLKIKFFCKAPDGKNILSFVGHTVFVTTTKFAIIAGKQPPA